MTHSSSRRNFIAAGGAGLAAAIFPAMHIAGFASQRAAAETGERFERFLPRGFDPRRDDAAQAIEAAAFWSSRNRAPVAISGRYLLGRTARIDADGAAFLCTDAELVLSDKIAATRTRNAGSIMAGLHILGRNVSIGGSCRLTGVAPVGKTFTQGLFAEEADDLSLGEFELVNLALGQHFWACERIRCGNTIARSMWGLQKWGKGVAGAGSAQVISACRDGRFGTLEATVNDKNARYLSVGVHSRSGARDNLNCEFGAVKVSGRAGSPWAQATGIRSSVNGRFAGGTGSKLSYLLLCQKYKTDDAYQISGNEFGSWSGDIVDSSASLDAAAYFWVEPGARAIGSNRIDSVTAQCNPQTRPGASGYAQTFGLYVTSGQLGIDRLDFDGFSFHVHASNCDLTVGSVRSQRAAYQPMQFGRGLTGRIGRFSVDSDLSGSNINAGMIRSMDEGPRGRQTRFRIDQFDCPASRCDRADYVLYNDFLPNDSLQIGAINGRAKRGLIWRR